MRTKKLYACGQGRGGTPGQATATAFGSKANCRRSMKKYTGRHDGEKRKF